MKQRQYLIIGGAFLALIALFYFFGWRNQKPRYDWEETGWQKKAYNEKSNQPYGTMVFRNLVGNYFNADPIKEINSSLIKNLPAVEGARKGTYVFIGAGMYLDSIDTRHLMNFVDMGNTALIISKTIPFDLMNYIYYEECDAPWDDYSTLSDTFNTLHLFSPSGIKPKKIFFAEQNQPQTYNWSYIPISTFCYQQQQRPIGFMDDSLVNFAVFPHGQGRFLLHTTPLAFSNYHLTQPEFQEYAAAVLSYLPEGPIWWDAFSRVPESIARGRNARQTGNNLPEEHVLSFILQQEPLAWSWYLLVGIALLYLAFRTLRRQRPIPVLPQNENSSYEFINTIAHLHFRQRNYKGISIQAMKLFLSQIREKYGIVIGIDPISYLPKEDKELYHRLSLRSEVPLSVLDNIFEQYKAIARFHPTEQHMVDFYLSLEDFWKKAK